jgi:heme/copper-type cytochrome/quinol oxidase subunit 4
MEAKHEPTLAGYVGIWIGLLCIVGIEVFLTFIEAAIGLLYFMHLKYEKHSLLWSLIPAVVFVLFMMNHIWPDAFRMASMKVPIQ